MDVPLPTLLSWAWVACTIEIDNAVEAATAAEMDSRFRLSLPMWANGLRCIDDGGTTVDDLHRRTRAGVNLGGLERWGYIRVGEGSDRRPGFGTNSRLTGTTLLRPTPAGTYMRDTWPRVIAAVEGHQRARFGAAPVDQLRRLLADTTDDTLPWAPPEVSPAGGFRTTVLDGDAAAATTAPFVVVLGRALTAWTRRYEVRGHPSLPVAANLLRVIGTDVVKLRDLPRMSGVSKEAIAMGTGWLRRAGLATDGPERSIALTERGRAELDGHGRRVSELDDAPLRAALEAVLEQREALAAGLVPPAGCWRGQRPYLIHTEAVLADPIAALPWQPMVLHRGGWPDGS